MVTTSLLGEPCKFKDDQGADLFWTVVAVWIDNFNNLLCAIVGPQGATDVVRFVDLSFNIVEL